MTVERLALLLFWADMSGLEETNVRRQWGYRLTAEERAAFLSRAVRELTDRRAA